MSCALRPRRGFLYGAADFCSSLFDAIAMSKGLGKQQKAILNIISESPGTINEVYRKIKNVLYPEIEFIEPERERMKEIIELFEKYGHDAETFRAWRKNDECSIKYQRKRLKEDPGRKAILNRIRVSISTSIKGLVKRGYVTKKNNQLSINPNAFPRKDLTP